MFPAQVPVVMPIPYQVPIAPVFPPPDNYHSESI